MKTYLKTLGMMIFKVKIVQKYKKPTVEIYKSI
jgi:hypothetical protein